MEGITFVIIAGVVGLIAGAFLSRIILLKKTKNLKIEARDQANLIVKEAEISAENIKKDKILEAKEKFLKLKSEFEEEAQSRSPCFFGCG